MEGVVLRGEGQHSPPGFPFGHAGLPHWSEAGVLKSQSAGMHEVSALEFPINKEVTEYM